MIRTEMSIDHAVAIVKSEKISMSERLKVLKWLFNAGSGGGIVSEIKKAEQMAHKFYKELVIKNIGLGNLDFDDFLFFLRKHPIKENIAEISRRIEEKKDVKTIVSALNELGDEKLRKSIFQRHYHIVLEFSQKEKIQMLAQRNSFWPSIIIIRVSKNIRCNYGKNELLKIARMIKCDLFWERVVVEGYKFNEKELLKLAEERNDADFWYFLINKKYLSEKSLLGAIKPTRRSWGYEFNKPAIEVIVCMFESKIIHPDKMLGFCNKFGKSCLWNAMKVALE